jgi:hypothetical protein
MQPGIQPSLPVQDRTYHVQAIVFGVLGLCGLIGSLAVPWVSAFVSVGDDVRTTEAGPFDLGGWAAAYYVCAGLVLVWLAVALARPVPTLPAVLFGLVLAAGGFVVLLVVDARILDTVLETERLEAGLPSKVGDFDTHAAAGHDGGLLFAELALIALSLALLLTRPRRHRPLLAFGLGVLLLVGFIAVPSARDIAATSTNVETTLLWLPAWGSHGMAQVLVAALAAALVLTATRTRGWPRWPSAVGAIACLLATIALNGTMSANDPDTGLRGTLYAADPTSVTLLLGALVVMTYAAIAGAHARWSAPEAAYRDHRAHQQYWHAEQDRRT